MPLTFICGNGSERSLCERSRLNILVRLLKLFGTVPDRLLCERKRVSSALNFPRKSGIFPVRRLWSSSRKASFGAKVEIEFGIFPENLLWESLRIRRSENDPPKISGMGPESWF
ncbi:hypothetical protein PanWU01x14_330790 [Parasponia andersonii]|uniref:Uncharacterized protein n=1 Tax=Parasponia andersonii TaxID=3476 RepID=A0A2P5AHZ7_PARAD|nr:hypothetical protein PanWU01x14_330790 [Parasponia andersonii]